MIKHEVGNVKILVIHRGERELDWGIDGRPSHHFFYEVHCVNKKTDKAFVMPFFDSIANYQARRIYPEELMPAILAHIRADSQYTEDVFPTWESFADEFGYNYDDRDQQKMYKRCLRLADKINSVFTKEELESMPE